MMNGIVIRLISLKIFEIVLLALWKGNSLSNDLSDEFLFPCVFLVFVHECNRHGMHCKPVAMLQKNFDLEMNAELAFSEV